MTENPVSQGRSRAQQALEELMANELEAVRTHLIHKVDANHVTMVAFMEEAIAFWHKYLHIDRVFVCDMRSGEVVAGWNKGKNVARLQDWNENYVPLEMDATIQKALEGDELVVSPTPGIGADLALSLHLDNGHVWLVVLDQTDTARVFSKLDMTYISLVRDLAVIKSRLSPGGVF